MKKVAPKKHKKQSKVTLDSLAGMVAGGFIELRGEMNDRFNQTDKRFEEVDSKLEHMTVRIDTIDQKLSALRGEVLSMHYDYKKLVARLENLELRTFGSVQE